MPKIPQTADNFRKIKIENKDGGIDAIVGPDNTFDSLTLVAGDGIQLSAIEGTDRIRIGTTIVANTAGLNDILYNGTVSSYGVTVDYVTVDDTTFQNNTLLVDHATNNLTLTTSGTGGIIIGRDMQVHHVVPALNTTYDLGSADYRFRDLYLSGSSIKLGSATITADGSTVVLPSGSTINGTSFTDEVIPTQTGNTDKFLRTNGSNVYWDFPDDQLPVQTGNNGKFLFTNGSTHSWSLINNYVAGNIPNAVTFQNNVVVTGTLTVNGNTTTINSTTLTVDDKLIELGTVDTPTDLTADGGGFLLKAATDKSFVWDRFDDRWVSNIDINAPTFVGSASLSGGTITNLSGIGMSLGVVVTQFSTDTTFADNASDIVPVQSAIKSYVDTKAVAAATSATTNAVYTTGSYASPSWITSLSIAQGGTGASTAPNALTNLLPTGEVTGYILKTSGRGSYYWASETGASTIVGTKIDTQRQTFTADGTQTLFTFTSATYTPGAGQLRVYIQGIRQNPDAYTETSNSSFTLSAVVPAGTNVLGEIDGYKDFTVVASAVVSTPVGTLSATSVQAALEELDSEKATKDSPTFTGTVSGITKAMVGLGNVTNESKATMFSSPTFTGTVSGVTATHVGLGNVTNESKSTMFSSPAFTGTASSAGMTISKEATITTGTPGLGSSYGLHFNGQATNDYATGITFSAGSATASNANAGIYVQGSGAYGTKMYIATTDSYATGSKTAISIQHTGYTKIERSSLEVATSLGVGTSGSGTTGEIRATNNITAYYSDERLKTRLGNIENALDKIDQLNGFYYEANEIAQSMGYEKKLEVGVSAQETQNVLPMITAPAPIDENYLTVRYERFAPLLIEGIKELRQEINAIKKHLGM